MDAFLRELAPLPDGAEMKQWDQAAIEFGIPEKMLMENAGAAALAVAQELFGPLCGKRVCLFMGSGNNGGDAASLARLLCDCGASPYIYCVRAQAALSGSAAWHTALALKDGARFYELPAGAGAEDFLLRFLKDSHGLPDLIVDGLLGTGLASELRADMQARITMINSLAALLGCAVLALDIPSGLNSETGSPSPVAVQANATVTMAAAKRGLLEPRAAKWTGRLVCRKIGFPAAIQPGLPARFRLIAGECLCHPFPAPADSHKNTYGHVAVFGGANGLAGAAHLACAAALRAGAGLVTACAPAASLAQIKAGCPEIMTIKATEGADWPTTLPEEIRGLLAKAGALVVGPGMGHGNGAALFLDALLGLPERPPAIIDADALVILAANPAILAKTDERDLLTPHPGEAGKLLGCTASQIQQDRPKALDRLCALAESVVVLKGAGTLIGQRRDLRLLSPYDLPGLAIGGAGDVLAGCLGALVASRRYQELSPISKAALGVAIHAMAGLYLSRQYPGRGFLASELADALCHASRFVKSQQKPVPGLMPWPQ